MIEGFRAYIKSIASFMIFIMLIRIISPDRYEKYIDFICSVVFLMIVFTPLTNVFSNSNVDKVIFKSINHYDEAYEFSYDNSALKRVFVNELKDDINNYAKEQGVSVSDMDIMVSEDFDVSGKIESINIFSDKENSYFEEYIKNIFDAEEVNVLSGNTGG